MGIGVALLVSLGVGLGLADALGFFGRDPGPDAVPNPALDPPRSADRNPIPGATPNAGTDQPDLREIVEGLRASLDEQIRRHDELRAEVAALRAGIAEAPPIASSGAEDEAGTAAKGSSDAGGSQDAAPGIGFDDGALSQAGLHPSDTERLRTAWERATFEEMALKDAARREGWFNKKRYRDELAAIRWDLREELGESGFDALLYATGRSNRIVVTDVIARSSGAYAGFQEGDQIVSYAGRRVFTPRELERATSSGVSGSAVTVEVLRGGRSETLSVKRGPLGVVTRTVLAPPIGG